MGLFLENLQMALASIKSNKMRSFLTMLGIIIGITSVITITSLGDTITGTMNKYLSSFGKNRVMFMVKRTKLMEGSVDDTYSISDMDIKTLKNKFPSIEYMVPSVSAPSQKVKIDAKTTEIAISGIDYNYGDSMTLTMIHGRQLKESDILNRKAVIIIHEDNAIALFGKRDAVGNKIPITIDGQSVNALIVGVYKNEKTIFDSMSNGTAKEVFVPYSIFGTNYTFFIDSSLKDGTNIEKEAKKITEYLARIKNKDAELFEYMTMESQTQMVNKMFGTLSLGLGAIAAISLIVGGIGIMNIMLVSVTERTKEIGIRKSLGARKVDILSQFLIESVVLSAAGGIIGTALGMLLSFIFATVIHASFKLPIMSIIIAVCFSAGVGIFFGLFPANKAASLDPIDALRYE